MYQEFPKCMKHPRSRPADIIKWDPKLKPEQQRQGQPARFLDVTVNNLDQEQEYAAKGYVPAGQSDPEAYRRAMTNNEPPPESAFREYPKVLYRAKGDAVEDRVVASRDAEEALGAGWYHTPGEAQAAKPKAELKAAKPKAKSDVVHVAAVSGRCKDPKKEEARREKIRRALRKNAADRKAAQAAA